MIKSKCNESLIKSFFNYAIPCIVGMFLISCITIIDGIFIGNKLGKHGLAAINLTVPVLYFLLGITIMLGLGGVTIATHSLGAKNSVLAKRRFTLTLSVNTIVILIIILLLVFFFENVIHILNARGEVILHVKSYLSIMLYFYIFMMSNIIFAMFMRSEGKPALALLFCVFGNIINIILDYLFIFKFEWGMKGAALATGISIMIPCILGVIYFISGKSTYHFVKLKLTRSDLSDLKAIIFNGSSEFIGQISFCIATYLFNYVIINRVGIEGVAAFTIVGYVSFIEYMILTGVAQGINTLISFKYGAKDKEAILYLLSIGLKTVLLTGVVFFVVSLIAAEKIAQLFTGNRHEIITIFNVSIKIFGFSFLVNGYNFVASAYFTSIGNAKKSAIISILRSLLFISVFVFVLPLIFGDVGIWLSVPLSEIITFGFSYLFIKKSKLNLSFSSPIRPG